ncbi:exodeoxyribonuclease 7 large subunit [Clostridia bacterium]|nr:exodeoxyribonuclease 7 large subunit [Clostridia bacterium]
MNVFTVYQLNSYVKSVFERDALLSNICVMGEISNYKNHISGHLYFTIKDENAAVKCVCFRHNAGGISFFPENGAKVAVTGNISLYEKTGDYQLYVTKMERSGKGRLFEDFEALKAKLLKEGLFDEGRKRLIPQFPKVVGVVTSKSGAAFWDIVKVIKRRNPSITILLYDAQVQGVGAGGRIAEAIYAHNEYGRADCLIVGRGGGSYEDLSAFNEEIVARAVAASKVPVISAVGHETDFTIADFAADLRAPTPSAAAEMVSFHALDLSARINALSRKAENALKSRVSLRRQQTQSLTDRCIIAATNRLEYTRNTLRFQMTILENLSPVKTMERGFAAVTRGGVSVKSISGVQNGDNIDIALKDGVLSAKVTGVRENAAKKTDI